MPRNVVCGLIQCATPKFDAGAPVEQVRDAMFEKHLPFIEEAAKKGGFTVAVPFFGCTRVFSNGRRPSFGNVWSSLSNTAIATPPRPSKVAVPLDSSPAK